jgi:hypothetical protein
MPPYTATQDVVITISGEAFDLDTVLNVSTKFKVHPRRDASLEGPEEPAQAETLSHVITVKSDAAGIYGSAIMNAVTSAIDDAQGWLLSQAADADAAAEDDRADSLREERMMEDRA